MTSQAGYAQQYWDNQELNNMLKEQFELSI